MKALTSHRAAALIAGIATATLIGTTQPAHAEGTSDGSHPYDGQDPITTGCNANASLIATRPVADRSTGAGVATIEIYYSWSCETNWIRVTGNPYGGSTTKYISSSLGGWNSEWDAGTGSSYSMMVYAPGDTAVSGDVYLFEPGVEEWNWRAEGSFAL